MAKRTIFNRMVALFRQEDLKGEREELAELPVGDVPLARDLTLRVAPAEDSRLLRFLKLGSLFTPRRSLQRRFKLNRVRRALKSHIQLIGDVEHSC